MAVYSHAQSLHFLHQAMLSNMESILGSHQSPSEPSDGLSEAIASIHLNESSKPTKQSSPVDYSPGGIYFRRQQLATSLEGRRIDLITITDRSSATGELETLPLGLLPPGANGEPQEPSALYSGKKASHAGD